MLNLVHTHTQVMYTGSKHCSTLDEFLTEIDRYYRINISMGNIGGASGGGGGGGDSWKASKASLNSLL